MTAAPPPTEPEVRPSVGRALEVYLCHIGRTLVAPAARSGLPSACREYPEQAALFLVRHGLATTLTDPGGVVQVEPTPLARRRTAEIRWSLAHLLREQGQAIAALLLTGCAEMRNQDVVLTSAGVLQALHPRFVRTVDAGEFASWHAGLADGLAAATAAPAGGAR